LKTKEYAIKSLHEIVQANQIRLRETIESIVFCMKFLMGYASFKRLYALWLEPESRKGFDTGLSNLYLECF